MVVIGAGLGGLTAAALCAEAGFRVLVLERNANVGGAATVYQRGELRIEASLHEIDGLDADDPKLALLQRLGLGESVRFVSVGELYELRTPLLSRPFLLPHGEAAAIGAVTAAFPEAADGIAEYFRRLTGARRIVAQFARHGGNPKWWRQHLSEALRDIWTLLHEGRSTLGSVLNELFGDDERIKIALAANLFYYHDDPDELPFLWWAIPQASYLQGGGHYIEGGSQALSDALADRIRNAGGAVLNRAEVTDIAAGSDDLHEVLFSFQGGEAVERVAARVLLANAAPQCVTGMLQGDARQRFEKAYATKPLSISLWTAALGLTRPAAEFGIGAYSTFILPDWLRRLEDYRHAADAVGRLDRNRQPPFAVVDYGRLPEAVRRGPPYPLSLCGVDQLDNWAGLDPGATKDRKDFCLDLLVRALDQEFPGIAGAISQRELATAATMQHYLNTPQGAVYGFAPPASLRELLRRSPRTPVARLHLASAFTTAGGFTGAMLGGAAAARLALQDLQS
ncbi:MAG: NAD(P)/FAD-dependent oxidoreductase [Steroidobacteraceae bacterium]